MPDTGPATPAAVAAVPARGRFVTLEGGEGVGKSTQARLLAERLRQAGVVAIVTREPGGTDGAEQLRHLLLSGACAWAPLAELLLHVAARADHVAKVIRPALEEGVWVVCDRFADSTMAYQGFGQGADRARIAALAEMVGLVPDLTLILEVTPELARARQAGRGLGADRYERLGEGFFARVRDGFAAIAAAEPRRCAVIRCDEGPDEVGLRIWREVAARVKIP